jgi:SAM-dependent methyltransferase
MSNKAKKVLSGIKLTATLPIQIHNLIRENEALRNQVTELLRRNGEFYEELKQTKNHFDKQVATLEAKEDASSNRLSDVMHQISSVTRAASKQTKAASQSSSKEVLADNHLLDKFYVEFENNFRGTEEEIYERLEEYVPRIKSAVKKTGGKLPVLDIGCGRGEFNSLMTKNKIRSIGLDLNEAMVKHIIDRGGEAVLQDAASYLRAQKSNSFSAITGFHIVEHIPFDDLVEIFDECYRVLAPGGIIIFETPNPENLGVGAHTFYMDPSHLHPLPPALLEFTVKQRGFPEVEIHRLHPKKLPGGAPKGNKLIADMATKLYGPQDYAVIAQK